MEFKTSHLVIGFIGLALLSQGEAIRGTVEQGNQIRQQQSQFSSNLRQQISAARDAKALSPVALQRAKAGCFQVHVNGKPAVFIDGMKVLDTYTEQPLRDGAFVCNSHGDSAEVRNGAIDGSTIARVSPDDYEKFREYLNLPQVKSISRQQQP